jgi:hypothetical protein
VTAFEFVDALPNDRPRRREIIAEFADALRANPGRWAKFPSQPGAQTPMSNIASAINTRKSPRALCDGTFEAASIKGVCYVRYVKERAE